MALARSSLARLAAWIRCLPSCAARSVLAALLVSPDTGGRLALRCGIEARRTPRPGWARRSGVVGSGVGLQVGLELNQALVVLARVVAAEEQLSAGRKYCANLCGCTATVA